jgi:hypothetical protein
MNRNPKIIWTRITKFILFWDSCSYYFRIPDHIILGFLFILFWDSCSYYFRISVHIILGFLFILFWDSCSYYFGIPVHIILGFLFILFWDSCLYYFVFNWIFKKHCYPSACTGVRAKPAYISPFVLPLCFSLFGTMCHTYLYIY